jgi:hypothetical protein
MHIKPIPKIHAIHQTIVNIDGISARSLSCYTYTKCLSGNYSECELVNITGQFSELDIVPEANANVDEGNISDDPEIPLCELISKNTIFAVLCDDESYDYYLVKGLT